MHRLDERDIQILAILQKEGRITKTSLAEKLNLSLTPSWDRLQRLEDVGIIESYGAKLSSKFLKNFHLVITEVELESHKEGEFARFENAIVDFDEVLSCWSVGGSSDYILKIPWHGKLTFPWHGKQTCPWYGKLSFPWHGKLTCP